MSFKSSVMKGLGRAEFQLKRKSPEILIGLGIGTFIGTVVVACARTSRMDEVLEFHEERMNKIRKARQVYLEDPDNELEFSEKDEKKEVAKTYALTVGKTVKTYAPAIGLGLVSIGCFLTSYRIMRVRYLGAVALAQVLQTRFDKYRSSVRERYGDEVDREIMYGDRFITVTESDENGNVTVTQTADDTLPIDDDTCRILGPGCKVWDPNPHMMMTWLRGRLLMLNDLLHARGHVFLNEVYDALGFDHTPIGAIVGWIDGEGDDCIDIFGEIGDEGVQKFVNGQSNVILLTFNHCGPIWDRLPMPA